MQTDIYEMDSNFLGYSETIITYTPIQWRGVPNNTMARFQTSPAAVGGPCSLANCKLIFGLYYKTQVFTIFSNYAPFSSTNCSH